MMNLRFHQIWEISCLTEDPLTSPRTLLTALAVTIGYIYIYIYICVCVCVCLYVCECVCVFVFVIVLIPRLFFRRCTSEVRMSPLLLSL